MNSIYKIRLLFIGLSTSIISISCAPKIGNDIPEKPTDVDFSRFIAIGNSLTSGYADGGLYLEGQTQAFPNLIAEQMKPFGGGVFNSPLFDEAQSNGSGYLRLESLANGNPVMKTIKDKLALRGLNPNNKPLYTKYTGTALQNLGVPGMRMDMAFAQGIGTINGNPFFERLLPEGDNSKVTYFDYTTPGDHTFFSFWLGNNDILGYATNGAYEDPNDPTTTFTSVALFTNLLNMYISALTENGQKGIIANIPNVSAVPYFKTVTTARLEAGVSTSTQGKFNKIYISTADGVRQATEDDLFTLQFPTDTLGKAVIYGDPRTAGYGLIKENPLHDKFVLDKSEVLEVNARTADFNAAIKKVAEEKQLALADVNNLLNTVEKGYTYNGINISSKFITGNAFSLDGIHLTPMGYAITANLFLEAINKKYGTSLQRVDITKYRANLIP